MQLSGAQIVIQELIRQGADTIFGYPGGAVLDIYEALYQHSDKLKHVLTAHEQGAAHAADGYARRSGKVGVVLATSGPGATNLITGLATAYLDSVPIVALTGNVAVSLLGKDSFQEVDIVGISQPVVKHSFIVYKAEDLEHTINEAFRLAMDGRRGPVLVDIPKSVQRELAEYPTDKEYRQFMEEPYSLPDLSEALKAIREARRPFIYCGGGALASNAGPEVMELSKRISAPIGLSLMGVTTVPTSFENNFGVCGMHGKYAANTAQSEADVIIAVGVRFSDRATGKTSEYSRSCRIIHIDIDECEFGKNVPDVIELKGSAKAVLAALLPDVPPYRNEIWMEHLKASREIDRDYAAGNVDDFSPYNIIQMTRAAFDSDTVVATDVGQHQMWVMQHFAFESPHSFLTSGGLGTMGYGMGAAIGGCFASDKAPTLLFTGDGSFGMNLNEMATAVSYQLPLRIVLFNNGVLGMVRQWQTAFYDGHYSQTTLGRQTDFPKLAEAFGACGVGVSNLEELRVALEQHRSTKGPVLIDCHIDRDWRVLPMIPPGGSVKDMILE